MVSLSGEYTYMHVTGTLWQPIIYTWGMNFMSLDNESHVMADLRKLDAQAVGAIYDKYFPEVYRYVRYRFNDGRRQLSAGTTARAPERYALHSRA